MTADIKNIKALQDSVKQVTQSNLLKPNAEEFNSVFKEAAAAMSNVGTQMNGALKKKEKENLIKFHWTKLTAQVLPS